MMTLIYLACVRLPSEKAHGLQIVQNCEAFAAASQNVELWSARRVMPRDWQGGLDIFAYYGVEPIFQHVRVPMLDLMPLARGNTKLEKLPFYIGLWTYILAVILKAWRREAVFYSRDEWVLFALSFFKPRQSLVYEAHLFRASTAGGWLQRQVVRRCGKTIAITPPLRDDLIAQRGAQPVEIMVAHDGIRAARFDPLASQTQARQALGWPQEAFIVGFVGRLHMLNVDKGVGTLIQALAPLSDVWFGLAGGPEDMAAALRDQWVALGQPAERFLYAGHLPPDEVPRMLAACDVCAMPHPATRQFASYTSPLKLFEYMAAGRAIIASDLPGWADVVQHEANALLVPAGDAVALSQAIERLQGDPALRQRLGETARMQAMTHYTWAARAQAILAHIKNN
jgi:glycosyltransferase involved in cell wall biosynthesis